jgi:hypothetical protein
MADPRLEVGIDITAQTGGAGQAERALDGVKDAAQDAGKAVDTAAKGLGAVDAKPVEKASEGVASLGRNLLDSIEGAASTRKGMADVSEQSAGMDSNIRTLVRSLQDLNQAQGGGVSSAIGFAKALRNVAESAAGGNLLLAPLTVGIAAVVATWSKALEEIEADKAKFDELGETAEDVSRRLQAAAKADIKFDKLREELASIQSEYDKTASAALRLAQAQEELKDAQLALEMKKLDASKTTALAAVGDDSALRSSIELRDSMAREQLRTQREAEKAEARVVQVTAQIAAEKDKGIEIELRLNALRAQAEEQERKLAAARELLLRQGINPDTLTDDSRQKRTDEFQRIYNQTYDRPVSTKEEIEGRSSALSNYAGVIQALQTLPELVKKNDDMAQTVKEAEDKSFDAIRDTKDRIAELSVNLQTAMVGMETASAERAARTTELQVQSNKSLEDIRAALVAAQQQQQAALQAMAAANQSGMTGDMAGAAAASADYQRASGSVNSLQGLLQQAETARQQLDQTAVSLQSGVASLSTAAGQAAASAMAEMAKAGSTIEATGVKASKDVQGGAETVRKATEDATGAIGGAISQFGGEVSAAVDRTGQQFMAQTDRLMATIEAQNERMARQQQQIEAAAAEARTANDRAALAEAQIRNMR